jgi:hypothetical protein
VVQFIGIWQSWLVLVVAGSYVRFARVKAAIHNFIDCVHTIVQIAINHAHIKSNSAAAWQFDRLKWTKDAFFEDRKDACRFHHSMALAFECVLQLSLISRILFTILGRRSMNSLPNSTSST